MLHNKLATGFILLVILATTALFAQAETVELTTFFPTQTATDELDVGLLTADQVGIGIDALDPDVVLHVRGEDEVTSKVLFMKGDANTQSTDLRVGINWGNPFNTLHVTGRALSNSTIDNLQIRAHNNSNATVHRRAGIVFHTLDAARDPMLGAVYMQKADPNSHKMYLDVGTNAGVPANNGNTDGTTATVMTLTDAGNVGIGTADPAEALHVNGAALIRGNGTANGTAESLRVRKVNSYFGTNIEALIIEKTDDDTFVAGGLVFGFATSNANDTQDITNPGWAVNHTPVMVLRGNRGNVGIGTLDPLSTATAVPNGQPSNLDVNDVFLRSTGQWLSQQTGSTFHNLLASNFSLATTQPKVVHFSGTLSWNFPGDFTSYISIANHGTEIGRIYVSDDADGVMFSGGILPYKETFSSFFQISPVSGTLNLSHTLVIVGKDTRMTHTLDRLDLVVY